MTLTDDAHRVVSLSHSTWCPTAAGKKGRDSAPLPEGLLHLVCQAPHLGSVDAYPPMQKFSIAVTRGQVEALAHQLEKMLSKVGQASGEEVA